MYKVTIEKMERKRQEVNGEWKVIDNRPYTKKEVNDSAFPDDLKGQLKEILGYTPTSEKFVKSEKEVYMQIVDNMDLSKVIKAINGME